MSQKPVRYVTIDSITLHRFNANGISAAFTSCPKSSGRMEELLATAKQNGGVIPEENGYYTSRHWHFSL